MSLERREGSVDGSLSNGEMNESEMESSEIGSENGDDIESIDLSKITDPAQREHYEQLKKQEKEERAEIEMELKAHKEALARRGAELQASEIREQERRMLLHEQALRAAGSSSERHAEDLSIKSSRNADTPLSHSGLKPERSSLDMLNNAAYLEQFARSPPRNDLLQDNPAHHWTFEEQFKQLYELSEDPKRREFLDDLFSFMQKRGTPVNRIPIMAKQTLDLYELFRLVVSKGGLVEVINKKLWREITKGLNLPSSITSAAFTLRTQYMKYLYPYECEKLKLSSPAELQAAIDGNRREGRRPSYGYDLSPGPTLIPHTPLHLTNGDLPPNHVNGRPTATSPLSMNSWWVSQFLAEKSKEQKKGDEDSPLGTPNRHHTFTERDALAMEAASRAMEEATRKMEAASRAAARENSRERDRERIERVERVDEGPERKRMALSEEDRLLVHAGMPSAHLKITSRNDGRTDFDNSLVVSMEINGIMYQGVLFAQQARRM